MVYKHGKYGKFLACSGFPECKNTKTIIVTIEEKCPNCGGVIHVRKSKKGKKYYICENNKRDVEGSCEYYSYNKPGEEKDENKTIKKTINRTSKSKKRTSKTSKVNKAKKTGQIR